MKKKLFFVLLLLGSMFLNFNIADGWGSAGGGSPMKPTINL